MLFSFPLECLISKSCIRIIDLRCVGQLLCDGHFIFFNDRQVETSIKIGSSGTMFHIEHIESMAAVVYKCFTFEVFIDPAVIPLCSVREYAGILEALLDRRRAARTGYTYAITADFSVDLAGSEVDGSGPRIMDASDIKDQNAVDVDPQVVIAGEFINQRIASVQSVLRHHELILHGHAEIVIWAGLQSIQCPAIVRILIVKQIPVTVVQILRS